MSSTGRMGQQSSTFYSQFSELISEKRESSYSMAATCILRKIILALIKSIDMCLMVVDQFFTEKNFSNQSKMMNFHRNFKIL